jgi:hypothetical protein
MDVPSVLPPPKSPTLQLFSTMIDPVLGGSSLAEGEGGDEEVDKGVREVLRGC